MKQYFMKGISVLLTLVTVFGCVMSAPVQAFAAEEATSQTLETQTQAQGGNALAGVLADAVNEEQTEQQEQIYRITNILFDGWTAEADFYAPDNAKLVISVFDEESEAMLTTAQAAVDSAVSHASIVLPETEMPQYYFVKAFLLDENNLPLSEVYVDTSHTRRMEEFFAKTTADFDPGYVINADSSATNNFAVVSDSAILVDSAVNRNKVVRNDYDKGIFVFENADSTVKNLQPGDVIYVDIADYILAKVGSVEVDGNTVTVFAADGAEPGELFSYVKIDTAQGLGNTNGRVGASYADDESGKGKEGISMSQKFSASVSESVSSDKLKAKTGVTARASYSLSLTLNVAATGDLSYYYDINWGKDDYLVKYNCNLKVSGNLTLSVNGAIGFEAHILDDVSVPTPIVGLEVYIDASLSLMANVKMSTSGTLSISQNKGYHRERNTAKNIYIKESVNDEPKVEIKVNSKIEGDITLGFTVQVGLKLLKVVRLYLEGGASVTASFTVLDVHVSNNSYGALFPYVPWDITEKPELVRHECTLCLLVDLNAEITVAVGFKLSFKNEDKEEDEKNKDKENKEDEKSDSLLDLLKISTEGRLSRTIYLGKFRASVYDGKLEFEFLDASDECPHIKHLVTLLCVADNNGNKAAKNVSVKIKPTPTQSLTGQPSSMLPSVSLTTDAYGKIMTYLPTGSYTYTLSSSLFVADAKTNYDFNVNFEAAQLLVHMIQYRDVQIKVVDLAGNPVSGAAVSCGKKSGQTNSAGIVKLSLPLGAATVTASVTDFVGSLDAEIKEDTDKLTVVVDVGNAVTVTVVNEHGKPVEGVTVRDKTTNADGRATLVLEKGTHAVLAVFNDTIAAAQVTVDDKPVEVTIVMEVGTKITFIAKAANGSLLSNVSIDGKVRTDEDGKAALWLKDGDYTFTVQNAGQTASQEFTVSGEELTVEFTLQYPLTEISYTLQHTRTEYGSFRNTYYYKMVFSGFGNLSKEVVTKACEEFNENHKNSDDYYYIDEIVIGSGIVSVGDHAFSSLKQLRNVTLPSTLEHIEKYAFATTRISEINFPYGLQTIGDFAFMSCSSLRSVTLPCSIVHIGSGAFSGSALSTLVLENGITVINEQAFSGCKVLTSVTLPATVTAIEGYAFINCENVKNIIIPDSVTAIGDSAFANCKALQEIIIPDSVTALGKGVFSGCAELKSVTLPQKITRVSQSMFSGCKSLAYIEIPECVESIDVYAFSGCSSLQEISLPEGLKEFGKGVFSGCTALTYMPLTEHITTISESLFSGCSGLAEVVIPSHVTSVEDYAFRNCTGIKSLVVTSSVNTIGHGIIAGCTALETIYWNAVCVNKCNLSSVSSFTNAGNAEVGLEVVFGDSVEHVPAYLFKGNINLKKVTFSNHVKKIEKYAFSECDALTEITIPDSVVNIDSCAFYNCENLSSVTLPNSELCLGESSFNRCTSLTTVEIPEKLVSIEESVFSSCTALKTVYWYAVAVQAVSHNRTPFATAGTAENGLEVIFGESVEIIPAQLFGGCKNLTKVTIGSNVTTIGTSAFYDCKNLTDVEIGENVTTIGGSAFRSCESLCSILLPPATVTIGDSAFCDCSAITEIILPENVMVIGNAAFYNCIALKNIVFGNNVMVIGGNAFGLCTEVSEINLPESVTEIGDYAFQLCTGISEITIPYNIRTIGHEVFSGCTCLENVYWNAVNTKDGTRYDLPFANAGNKDVGLNIIIGDNVKHLPSFGFSGCEALKNITIGSGVESFGASVFKDCPTLEKVYWNAIYAKDQIYGYSPFEESGNQQVGLEVIFGDQVENIPRYLFEKSASLTCITIGENVNRIGEYAFKDCSALKIVYWNAVTGIGFTSQSCAAFSDAGDIANGMEVVFGEAVEKIPRYAFAQCSGLKSITIPDPVIEIEYGAFSYCSNLQYVRLRAHNGFSDFSPWEDVLPNTITILVDGNDNINSMAVKGIGIAAVEFGGGISKIPASALKYCSNITTVTIDSTVTEIGNAAFYQSGVSTINFLGTEEQWNSIVIGKNNEQLQNATVYFVTEDAQAALSVASVSAFSDDAAFADDTEKECIYLDGAQPATRQDTAASITVTDACVGNTYVMFIFRDPQAEDLLSAENLLYIDQKTAEAGELTFRFTLPDDAADYTIAFTGAYVYIPDCATAGHDFAEWKTVSQPSCAFEGMRQRVCKKCLAVEQEAIEANGHAFEVTMQGTSATCTTDGISDELTCTVCGEVQAQCTIPCGHRFGEWVITEATDSKDGSCVRTCTACGTAESRVIRAEPTFPMSGTKQVRVYAGEITYLCFRPTVSGKLTVVSVNSGDTYGYVMDENKNVLAENDDADEGFDFALTYTFEAGRTYYIGVRDYQHRDGFVTVGMLCPHTETTAVQAVDPTCSEDGNTAGEKCLSCGQMLTGEILPATGAHSWNEGSVTIAPTTDAYGEMVFTCTHCGAQRAQALEKLQVSFTDSDTVFVSASDRITALAGSSADEILTAAGASAVLVDKDGNPLDTADKVGTGAVLTLADGTWYEIIVPGDTNGDGEIASADARFALRYSVGLETVAADSAFVLAAAVDTTAGVSSSDARTILRASVGLDNPSDWLESMK